MRSAVSAFMHDKPHSSVTHWVEVLSGENYKDDDLDGIPELVDAMNLQPTGPGEASRAIRKKLKYGNVHRQLRALVILKALVENGGSNFQTAFADGRLTEQLKTIAFSAHTDQRVKKRLVSVLVSWHRQFKDDPSMRLVSNIYPSVQASFTSQRVLSNDLRRIGGTTGLSPGTEERERKERERKQKGREEKEARKAKEREEVERKGRDKAAAKDPQRRPNKQRKSFNFELEKPNILSSIATASQASNNLINALKLVNREKESIEENTRVQETLTSAKVARKAVVRYIQLVENEEIIGTLIDTHERIITALEMYDELLKTAAHDSDDTPPASPHSDTPTFNSQLDRLQEKQRVAVEREKVRRGKSTSVHPDLADLRFGDGDSVNGLPPPIQPNAPGSPSSPGNRASLSDYSDYDSSGDEVPRISGSKSIPASTRYSGASGSGAGKYDYQSRKDEDHHSGNAETESSLLGDDDDDPFADPFADPNAEGVRTPGIPEKKGVSW